MLHESPHDTDEPGVLCAFLQRYLADRTSGEPESLAAYQARYPGYEAAIAREFARLSAAAADGPEDRYEVQAELGRGGMGVVYRVWDRRLRRTLAMKVLARRGPFGDDTLATRFLEEAQVTSQLQHPGIVPLHELGTDAVGRPYYTMPLVDGQNLKDVFDLVAGGRDGWTLDRALDVLLRVCDAVRFAHNRGVVHRDLKPANVMVGGFGEVYVMDWGLAGVVGEAQAVSSARVDVADGDAESPLLTRPGDVVGTPAYMAPEQARGDTDVVGPSADVYALGGILYHLLTGTPPHQELGAAPLPILERRPDAPAELVAICEKAMARPIPARYSGAEALAHDLRAFRDMRVVGAYEAGTWAELKKWVQRNRALAAASIVAVLALVVGTVLSSLSRQRADRAAIRWKEEFHAGVVEQGRLLARAGQLSQAEQLLWQEYFVSGTQHSFWALCELYHRRPCLGARKLGSRVTGVFVHTDGGWAATTDETGLLSTFDADTMRPRHTMAHHRGRLIYGLAGRADGLLASVDGEGDLVLTDGSTGQVRRVWTGVAGQARMGAEDGGRKASRAVAFSPDGRVLGLATSEGGVRLYDPGSGAVQKILRRDGEASCATCLRFSPSGDRLAVAGEGGVVRVFDLATGAETRLQSGSELLLSLAFTGDGGHLFVGGRDRVLREWDLGTGELVRAERPQNGSIFSLTLDPTGRVLAVGGMWRLELRDVESLAVVDTVPVINAWSSAFAANGQLLTGHIAGLARLWDLPRRDGVLRLTGHRGRCSVAFHPGGAMLAVGDEVGAVRVYDLPGGRLRQTLHHARGRVISLQFHPHRPLLVAGYQQNALRLWDLDSGESRLDLNNHDDMGCQSSRFDPTGTLLAHTAVGGGIEMIDLASGAVRTRIAPTSRQAVNLSWSAGGDLLASTSRDRHIRLWRRDGTPVAKLRDRPWACWSVACEPAGSRIVSGDWRGLLEVYDVATGALEKTLTGHASMIPDVAFRPGAAGIVASASTDRSVRLWDIDAGRCLLSLDAVQGTALSLAWGPKGRRLAVAGDAEEVVVWDLETLARRVAANLHVQEQLLGEQVPPSRRAERRMWAETMLAR